MCGRYTLKREDFEALLRALRVKDPREFVTRYNIGPRTPVPAIRTAPDGAREAVALEWGLLPRWSKDPRDAHRPANARAEGIAGRPAFREAFRHRRCVVPASGFYEWQTIGKTKHPWYFQFREAQPFLLAGIWESWTSADGVELQTCSLITTEPNDLVRPLHDRMPVILRDAGIDVWLDRQVREPAQLEPLLRPTPAELMTATPVSPFVNSIRHEGPECIEPAVHPPEPPAPRPDEQLGLALE